jgi:MoxR-like ATPase
MYYAANADDIGAARRAELTVGQLDRDDPADYKADPGLVDAVNVALVLNKPLLLTGDPGTGKSQLAFSVAWQLAARGELNVVSPHVERFEAKSTSIARDLFYTFDMLGRFHADKSGGSMNNKDYITYSALGRALLNAVPRKDVDDVIGEDFKHTGPMRSVVLIDEIDKAPRDFPNDLLNEIDQMFFRVTELKSRRIGGVDVLPLEYRPLVFITSNSEKNLPDPFMRRCIYYNIPFPEPDALRKILLARLVELRPAGPEGKLLSDALDFFVKLRGAEAGGHKISPAELIQWLAFMIRSGADPKRPLQDARKQAATGLPALVKDTDGQRIRAQLETYLASK